MQSASEDAKHVRLAISASGPGALESGVVATLRRLGITVLSRQTASAHGLSASLRIGWYQRGFPTPIQPLQGRPAAGRVSDERARRHSARSGSRSRVANGGRPL